MHAKETGVDEVTCCLCPALCARILVAARANAVRARMRVCGFLCRTAGNPHSLVMATPQVATIVNSNQAFEKNLFASVRKPKSVSIRG